MRTTVVRAVLVLLAAACGDESRPPLDVAGSMRVRAVGDVALASVCTEEASRRLVFEPDDGADAVPVELLPGRWQEDQEVPGAIVCDLTFSTRLPGASAYDYSVNDSESSRISYEDLKEQASDYQFFDPSQFYDPDSYRP